MLKEVNHFFLRLNGTDESKPFTIHAGMYVLSRGFLYKKEVTEKSQMWKQVILKALLEQNRKDVHILIYIHGYLAENPWFASLSGYTMHQEIFDEKSHDVTCVFSFQWESGFYTSENRQLAYRKGEFFDKQLRELAFLLEVNGKEPKFSFLVHSMGNRVLEGLVHSWKKMQPEFQVDQMFLCAADVPADVFENSFSHLTETAVDVHVLFHQEDKTLRFANVMIPFPRLGILGNQGKEQKIKNLHFTDVTIMAEDDTALGSRISHHRYFYGSKNVVNYINFWLRAKN